MVTVITNTHALGSWNTDCLLRQLTVHGQGEGLCIQTKQRTHYTDKKTKCPYVKALHCEI